MRHSYEKAMDIATQLMAANLTSTNFGCSEQAAENLGRAFIKLVETIQPSIEDMPE